MSEQRNSGFKFDASVGFIQLSDEELLSGLRRHAESVGNRPFSMKQYDRSPLRTSASVTVSIRFGSWREALRRIGVAPTKAREYTPQELVTILERAWCSAGRPPGRSMLRRHARITSWPYERVWGTLANARKALDRFHKGQITREELLAGQPGWNPKPVRKPVPVSVRWRIFQRDGHRCQVCGRSPASTPGLELHLDHILAVAKGGGNEEGNLRTLCSQCNLGKADRGAP